MVAARRLTVCMVATACLSLTANLWMRNQRATATAVQQEQRWSALSQQLDLAALATPILASPPPAAAPSPPASSPALSSATSKAAAAAARLAPGRLAAERAAAAKRAAAKRTAAQRAAAKRAAAKRPASAPGQAAATHDIALRSSRGASAAASAAARGGGGGGDGGGGGAGQLAAVDTEDGVRQGSRCRDESDKRTLRRPRCPDASDIVAELDAEAAREAAAGEAAGEAAAARAPVCLLTALTCNHSNRSDTRSACRRVRCASSPPLP